MTISGCSRRVGMTGSCSMRRRALFFCLACVFSAVSTNPASAAFETVRRVGVISALGDTFAVQKVGITVFGNDQKEFAIDSWKIDDFVIGKVRAALGKRFDVRPVTYQKAAFLAPPPNIFTSANTAVANAVRAH